ncbi:N-acetylglucosamine-6-phosphate deacetylase [Cyanobacterium sp. uoEpiScrs1]|uniref:N-acetylglucosamine-6-phosphate deacetylase n=1 Tax=Cyanobacterium sp. uoEpiScrs1 TaxID=2976343 RepID=UPI0022699D2A|nr:N-acetylglucosamine-6-phosphate deacetylase [Cyanobacterium sp. uoEpiScrs1]
MLKDIIIINAKISGYQDSQQVYINSQGIIENILPMKTSLESIQHRTILDLKEDNLSLGGIDLQINGALGLAFSEIEEKDLPILQRICNFLWQEGVDGFCPTIITTSVKNIHKTLSIVDKFISQQSIKSEETAKVLGVHLEGPFLNPQKKGAHREEYLLTPSIEAVKLILGDYVHRVKIITLAPELDSTYKVIPYLKSQGITVSLGHSQATDKEAKKAFELGASMVTHAYNAMPSLHHRNSGLLGEAIINKNVYCGLIADGRHVCPTMIEILLKSSHYDQGVFLVSDALSPIGLGDGIYLWDERQIEVKQGTASLMNGTLSGTTLPLFSGLGNLVKWGICEIETAISLVTESPRKAIRLPGISKGQPAHLLRWHWDKINHTLNWKRLKKE